MPGRLLVTSRQRLEGGVAIIDDIDDIDGSIAVVLGTRPEIVKLAPVIDALGARARVIHSGQHYDDDLDGAFFRSFGLPPPTVRLEVGGMTRGAQLGEGARRLDEYFGDHPPLAAVVQGDTNTTLAAALAANARQIPLVHVEAGLRSFDRRMPEEHNRVLTDHLADLCCAPTPTAAANLEQEHIPAGRVTVTGNTVVEALAQLVPAPEERVGILARHGLRPAGYILATLHRPENVDEAARLEMVLAELGGLAAPVVLALHPRTASRVEEFGLGALLAPLRVTPPLDYAEFLALFAECALAVSDSGGVQEEASLLKRPVVVVRNSTERPEVLGTFARLVQPGPAISETAQEWLDDLGSLHAHLADLPTPYGDGTAAARTVAALDELLAGP